jgi:TusE/DsrC/DsvC family sulfur relay protein
MAMIESEGTKVEIDDAGFLVNFEEWNEKVAAVLAGREGIGRLSKDSLDILIFIRSYYREHRFFPILRAVCKNIHQPGNCVTESFMDPVKAWKIAGLPNPGDEVNIFKSWEPLGF